MKIRIHPTAVLFWGILLFTGGKLFAAALLAAAFHEMGHLLAAHALGVRLSLLELDLLGAKLTPAGALPSYRAEWLLAAGGPAASILLALLLLPLEMPLATAIRTASASFALFNLLPVAGFDGGRMLHAVLAHRCRLSTADTALAVGSCLSLLFLFCLSACLLLRYGQNLALLVLSASLFARIFLPQRTI